ncbi:spore germination protein [Paenibacillus rhizophilus]|nr:spore germination protein [Paenibacillus rhizophilus]
MNQKFISKQETQYSDDHLIQLTTDITQNKQIFTNIFENCSDVVFQSFEIKDHTHLLVIYIEELIDTKHFESVILKPLMYEDQPNGLGNLSSIRQLFQEQITSALGAKTLCKVTDITQQVLRGHVAVLAQGENKALLVNVLNLEKRGLEEPSSELVIRGPKEAFIENIASNLALLRKRLRTPRLKIEKFTIGELSQTDLAIAYINGIATNSIIEEVRKRVSSIQIDGVMESGYIEEFIEDLPFSPFPQVHNTERPDVVASMLLEGKVAIFVDTTPFVLIIPMTFWSALQSSEDYYERFMLSTSIRWIRYLFLLIALFLPSLYVALTTYHQEMIPTSLLISIAIARENVPFPALVEALIMEIVFEALREAGVRLPRAVSQAMSIVGALVIGQAAVQAGIVSTPMVIVVAITGIANFTIPRFNFGNAIRLLRFPMIILAGTLGLYGVLLGILTLLLHVASLRSFGVPYFSPISPLSLGDLKDVVIRKPWWAMNFRERIIRNLNPKRIPEGQKPSPKRGKDGN